MNKRYKQNQSGFTLLEALFFILFISIIVVSVIYSSSLVIRKNTVSEQKILASHFSEEVREWLRGEKEADWPALFAKSSVVGITYCFNASVVSWPSAGNCQGSYSLSGQYLREVTLTRVVDAAGNSQIRAIITVSFKDGVNVISARDNTLFAPWE